jgi:putative glutamine amidotransferase
MTQPLIGITSRNENPQAIWTSPYVQDYIRSVEQAGGKVRILPAGGFDEDLDSVADSLDGILFSGGGDIDPARFNGVPHPAVDDIEVERDIMEFGLLQRAIERGMPFLGICRGIQVVNVGLGGTLYTDIPDQLGTKVPHVTPAELPKWDPIHSVDVLPGTWLAAHTPNTSLRVNSRHHQGILNLADGLRVMAVAPDGLIEAVSMEGHPFGIAFQWHPENMFNDKDARMIFQQFIQAAGKKSA